MLPKQSKFWLQNLSGRDQAELLMVLVAVLPQDNGELLQKIRSQFPGTDLWFESVSLEAQKRLDAKT